MRPVVYLIVLSLAGLNVAAAQLPILNPPPQDDCGSGVDAGESYEDAVSITPGTCEARMTRQDGVDVFRFRAEAGQFVQIDLRPDPNHYAIEACFEDPSGTRCDPRLRTYAPDSRWFIAATTGDWLVHFRPEFNPDGPSTYDYAFDLTVAGETAADPQNDCGTGGGAGNAYTHANLLQVPVDCEGAIRGADAWDWYVVPVTVDQHLTVTLDVPADVDLELCIFSPWGEKTCSLGPQGEDERIERTSHVSGGWWVQVYRYAGDGMYGLGVRVDGPPGNELPDKPDLRCPISASPGEAIECRVTLQDDSAGVALHYSWDGVWGRVPSTGFVAPGTEVALTFIMPAGATVLKGFVEDSGGKLSAMDAVTIYVRPPKPAHEDCGLGGDAGDTAATATPLPGPRWRCAGQLFRSFADPVDAYAIDVEAGQPVRIEVRNFSSTPSRLLGPAGEEIEFYFLHEWTPEKAGRWTLVLGITVHNVSYELSVTTRETVTTHRQLAYAPGPIRPGDAHPALADLDGFLMDLPPGQEGNGSLEVRDMSARVRFHDAEGAQLGGEGSADHRPTQVPAGAVRARVTIPGGLNRDYDVVVRH